MKQFVFLFFIAISFITQAQDSTASTPPKNLFVDFITGPYLFVHHHDYKSVFLTGARLGYEFNPKFAFSLEYMVGQQHDVYNQLGMTHTANGQLTYFFYAENTTRIRPYLHLGGGFFEFKDFEKDVLGVAWNTGGGATFNITPTIKGFIEGRYVNLGWLNLGGQHELGVHWGVRAKF